MPRTSPHTTLVFPYPYSPEFVEEEFCELRHNGVLRSSRKAPSQLAGWWRTRSKFLPQASLLASYGSVATRIRLS
jgi:hypothetical protein